MIITVANPKGGSGKTTTAVYLAAALAADRPVELLDATTTFESLTWVEEAGVDGVQASWSGDNLPEFQESVDALRSMGGHVVIDTGPSRTWMQAAIAHADVAVIPARSGWLDLNALIVPLDACDTANVPPCILPIACCSDEEDRRLRTELGLLGAGALLCGTSIPYDPQLAWVPDLAPGALDAYRRVAAELLLAHHVRQCCTDKTLLAGPWAND